MKFSLLLAGLALLSLGACRTYPDQVSDLRFPVPTGDIARGQVAFQELGCVQCHSVKGVTLPRPGSTPPARVELGGELTHAKTYGDLVSSIINPQHVISERYLEQFPPPARRDVDSSPMYMKPEMKVTQLIDIVAFLNSRYTLLPGYTEYYY